MKRSEVNAAIEWAIGILEKYQFKLPRFAYWSMEEWEQHKNEIGTLREVMMGWDITDFGSGDFEKIGAVLFTIRNGKPDKPEVGSPYAEKILLFKEGQRLPIHYHVEKTEDIINRGGGTLIIHVYNDKDGELDDTDVLVNADGRSYYVKAGTGVELRPGESITLWPHQYHDFDVVEGTGDVLIGEVSMCNDDNTDNRFYEPVGRFPEIEEDEEPYRLLCNEYPLAK